MLAQPLPTGADWGGRDGTQIRETQVRAGVVETVGAALRLRVRLMAQPPWSSMPVAPGTVLDLTAGQWEYGDGPLRLRVVRVLGHLSRYYDGRKIWIDGVRLDEGGLPVEAMQILVRTDALPPGQRP